jgi:hypothetical protein
MPDGHAFFRANWQIWHTSCKQVYLLTEILPVYGRSAKEEGMRLRAGIMLACMAVLFSLASVAPAHSQLYGATGSGGVNGRLFIIDPTTGLPLLDIGPLLTAAGAPVGITGLAFDPVSGTLYGSTANASPNLRGHLVTINTVTALVTDIGDFPNTNSTLADLTFDPTTNTLYGWQAADSHRLVTVNLANATDTLIGPGTGAFGGGGLASDAAGTLFSTPDGVTNAPGTLNTVDKVTGILTLIGGLSGSPLPNGMTALAFDAAGILFGVNLDAGEAARHLVTINVNTGAVTDIGRTVDNLDAIAFRPTAVPEPGFFGFLVAGGVGGMLLRRRRRSA